MWIRADLAGLPFSEDELAIAYERFYPREMARENAGRLVALIHGAATVPVSETAETPDAHVTFSAELLASLALTSSALEERVGRYLEEVAVLTRETLEAAFRRRANLKPDMPLAAEDAQRVEEVLAGWHDDWERCLARVRSGEATLEEPEP